MRWNSRALAALAGAGLTAAGLLGTGAASAATTQMCTATGGQYQSTAVDDGAYYVGTDEWNSTAAECVTTDGNADFTVTQSAIDAAAGGSPGAYPSISTSDNGDISAGHDGLPIQVGAIGDPVSSWSTTQPSSGTWDVSYDNWYGTGPATSGEDGGTELMIFLNYQGLSLGTPNVASDVSIDGATYNVYSQQRTDSGNSWNLIMFVATTATTSVSDLDFGDFTRDALGYGYLQSSWYLNEVSAGFEIWTGGAGLATNSFSFSAGTTTSPPASAGSITSGIPGDCLDDWHSQTTAGNPVDLYSCNASDAQDWTVQNGTIGLSGVCLDISGQGTATGTPVVLNSCDGSWSQQWQAGSGDTLVNPHTGLCLDDPGNATAYDTQLDLATCDGASGQSWRLPYTGPAVTGEVTAGIAGDCLDDWHGQVTAGNPVDLYPCNNTSSQDWTVDDNDTIQRSGDCVSVADGSTAEGAAAVLDPCSGAESQEWLPGPDGYLVSPQTGFCLDDPGSSTSYGTQLDISACTGGDNQIWNLPTF